MNLELILMSENDIAEFKKNVQCAFQKGFEIRLPQSHWL